MKIRFLLLCTVALACAPKISPLLEPTQKRFQAAAPDSFEVEIMTTKGRILVRARRDWAPNGVDRFYALVRNKYYDSVAFYRTVPKFVAQFGFTPDSTINAAWPRVLLKDDPVRTSNVRGTLVYARSGPDTRSVQMYFNIVDNARLDTLNGFGFPPIARTMEGVEVLDSLYSGYGNNPVQGTISRRGTKYLKTEFPQLDYILRARVVRAWKR